MYNHDENNMNGETYNPYADNSAADGQQADSQADTWQEPDAAPQEYVSVAPEPVSEQPPVAPPPQSAPPVQEPYRYPNNYMATYPTYGSHYMPADQQQIPPAYAIPAAPDPAAKKKKHTFLPLAALCLCFTLTGGILGGVVGSNIKSVPPEVPDAPNAVRTETPDKTAAPETKAPLTPVAVYPDGTILSPSQVYELCNSGVVAISTETTQNNVFGQSVTRPSAGSGFIISGDGYVVTNNHVIDGANKISVLLTDGTSHAATIVGHDVANDLAVLKIEATGLNALTWGDSKALTVGSAVTAIGNPLGELANTMTSGIVSALGREINIDGTPMTMLQTDASVSPGNSGGPLFDQRGQVVGIVSAKSLGTGAEGLGFAIPEEYARSIIEQLIEHGYVTGRPQLGISIQAVDASMAQYYNLPIGVYVVAVEEGSCAEKAGLQIGDVITEFGDTKVTSQEELIGQKNLRKAGETVQVKIVRAGKTQLLSIVLDEAQPASETTQPEPQQEEQPDRNQSREFDPFSMFPWSQQQELPQQQQGGAQVQGM